MMTQTVYDTQMRETRNAYTQHMKESGVFEDIGIGRILLK